MKKPHPLHICNRSARLLWQLLKLKATNLPLLWLGLGFFLPIVQNLINFHEHPIVVETATYLDSHHPYREFHMALQEYSERIMLRALDLMPG